MPKRTSTHDLVLRERPPGMPLSHWIHQELPPRLRVWKSAHCRRMSYNVPNHRGSC
jgi:hypothetical protein